MKTMISSSVLIEHMRLPEGIAFREWQPGDEGKILKLPVANEKYFDCIAIGVERTSDHKTFFFTMDKVESDYNGGVMVDVLEFAKQVDMAVTHLEAA